AGRIDRRAFAVGLGGVLLAFYVGVRAADAALPWMAEKLAPRGINAAFVVNAIWSMLGLLLVWSLIALGAKRLRDRGRSPWWSVAAVLPLAMLALLNDAIFLVSKSFAMPSTLNWAVLLVAGGIGLWLLWEGLFLPARNA